MNNLKSWPTLKKTINILITISDEHYNDYNSHND